jgi:hypothetical protein
MSAGARVLPTYSGDQVTCVKCGYQGHGGTRYVARLEASPEGLIGECLQRECGRCGFVWAQAVITP